MSEHEKEFERELRARQKKQYVTILIGLLGDNFLLLASDSQTTNGTSKNNYAIKIHELEFADGHKALIAQSGEIAVTSNWIWKMQVEAKKIKLEDAYTPAKVAEKVVREIRNDLMSTLATEYTSADEKDQYFRGISASLMIGVYFQHKPYLFTIDLWRPIAVKCAIAKNYATLGCGAPVAEFIIKWLEPSTSDFEEAMASIVYVIESVVKGDAYCMGPAQLAAILPLDNQGKDTPNGFVSCLAQNDINSLADELAKFDSTEKEQWRGNIQRAIEEARTKWSEKKPKSIL